MNDRIEAIYENGVFKPLGEVSLPEHFRVVLRLESEAVQVDDPEVVARQKRAAALLDVKLEQIPDNSPDDGFSSEDHDRILYGGKP
ncbi:MAG TPA: antitoxin family protein [Urbifossiella sp.]|jgi:predicted DNA-binding antitoxin AbrB/MazE fold protein